ncbi:hypothetical protein A2344_03335 [Candidatus Peregrinibacteria bacterium RIFOXYB12_FULL_41_12]|nr:MAG: hypothetical protein A2244_02050 [Candidatus Peregrinibacteria bacterium RIFOXYA2_FULL_41_18]OGJ48935.1 MAG: hypothetical protein A2344_03335 [Candidatus Peregrinibacteria bacterium RIFOXYB12_FULL_41_12]OGJ51491.1 MAG: hypothetical protein A2336_02245 [Candidatus Peregrinibacteria bacterium RIFOXYB2_FULL_41_88]OGJ52596.1 MAG: hypothetical protein A2448_02455 [Candidatus Peregrinibacteria bacterium RIFOXYC2_FULL_41_22]
MIKISYKPNFVRSYKKLPSSLQQEVKEKIGLFTENPSHIFLKTHKLKGKLKGLYSFSVNYQYRIVFLYKSEKEVSLLAVGDHDIYK